MRFKIAEKTYSLTFHHSLPMSESELLKMDNYNHRDMYGETEVILYELQDVKTGQKIELDRAVAYCAPEDMYVKSVGRKIALQKLLKNSKLDWMSDRGFRKRFWSIYFAKTAEMPEEIYVKYFQCPKITHAYNGVTLKSKDE